MRCPCNPEASYQQCCQAFHLGEFAPSAEKLMRSRYSAYVLNLAQYLLETWHADTRPTALNLGQSLKLDQKSAIEWRGLTILQHEKTSENTAIVEFIAKYSVDSKAQLLHETSRFVLLDRWLYVDGKFN